METRKCVVTGKIANKDELLRFAVLDNGQFIPDFDKKLDGRGVYLSNSRQLLVELSQKEKPLNKILHKNVIISDEIPHIVENILLKKASNGLNLARKAGDLVLGFEKVKEAVVKGKAAFVIEANDAGEDGKQKVAEMAKNIEVIKVFNVETLSEALNRENTVYLAVLRGKTAKMTEQALKKYQTYINNGELSI